MNGGGGAGMNYGVGREGSRRDWGEGGAKIKTRSVLSRNEIK